MLNSSFWNGQRVFLTGHSGFKGSWTALWLERLGAKVSGYALAPETEPNLFELIRPSLSGQSRFANILDKASLDRSVADFKPTLALHMAAQPLVRRSYREPAETYATNVMGTLNVLDALKHAADLQAVLVVTTDKVYRNDDQGRPFIETDPLGGHDPYSSSKAACEELVSCYRQCFFSELDIALATARAGNVIGGGDWSEDRLIPDIWRAMAAGENVTLRFPDSTRPWQHVLDPVSGYLMYLEELASNHSRDLPFALNLAPRTDDVATVKEVTETMCAALGGGKRWTVSRDSQPREMKHLALDASLAHEAIGWQPQLCCREAIEWTADWYLDHLDGGNAAAKTIAQIEQFEDLMAQTSVGRAGH